MNTRILIVDDEPHMLRLIELSLRKGGFELLLARNGQEGIDAARREGPDLIIMDVNMPTMDGMEALARLKEEPGTRSIPVIMLTARGQVLTPSEADKLGFDLYVTKPFSPTELLAHARRLLAEPDTSSGPHTPSEGSP